MLKRKITARLERFFSDDGRYALLVDNRTINRDRYYATPITIAGKDYYICNDWYENKKHLLIDWIAAH